MKLKRFFVGFGWGFTLIELLVTIAIIGILAGGTVMILNPSAQRQKANDAKRKSDLGQIQNALDAYYNDNGKYPGDITDLSNASGAKYIATQLTDPTSGKRYLYISDGQAYCLYASMDREENKEKTPMGNENCSDVSGTTIPCNYSVSSSNTNTSSCAALVAGGPSPAATSTLPPTSTATTAPTPKVTATTAPTPKVTATPVPTVSPENPTFIKCDETVTFSGASGTAYRILDLGDSLGWVELTYDTVGIPDKITVDYAGVTVIDTGFRGWSVCDRTKWLCDSALAPSYDYSRALLAMGRTAVVGGTTGSALFYRGNLDSRNAYVTVYSPLSGTKWNFTLKCPTPTLETPTPLAPSPTPKPTPTLKPTATPRPTSTLSPTPAPVIITCASLGGACYAACPDGTIRNYYGTGCSVANSASPVCCVSSSTPTPKPTHTPRPTRTPGPTQAPGPTHTPKPTYAPGPIRTAGPTATPKPLPTPPG